MKPTYIIYSHGGKSSYKDLTIERVSSGLSDVIPEMDMLEQSALTPQKALEMTNGPGYHGYAHNECDFSEWLIGGSESNTEIGHF